VRGLSISDSHSSGAQLSSVEAVDEVVEAAHPCMAPGRGADSRRRQEKQGRGVLLHADGEEGVAGMDPRPAAASLPSSMPAASVPRSRRRWGSSTG
jgi:hypothetical protein